MKLRLIASLAILAGLVAVSGGGPVAGADAPRARAATRIPKIKHVFIIVLENRSYSESFGPNTKTPYLAKRLAKRKGVLLDHYYAIGHYSNDNYIAMISGQAPNADTQADCQIYSDFGFQPNVYPEPIVAPGQAVGQGCVYPSPQVQTIANELTDHGYTWKGYIQDMQLSAPVHGSPNCVHPSLNSHDGTQSASGVSQYAARHNPFVYFHSLLDQPPRGKSLCERFDVPLNRLAKNLKQRSTTPNYSFIVPDLCNDGHDEPCVTGSPGGQKQANSFLRRQVPKILHSPGYNDRGLLLITFDEAEAPSDDDPNPPNADASACCNEQSGPNTVNPGGPTPGPGGGRVGAVIVSPCVRPGRVITRPINHYSMLRSIEDLFNLPHLGYAQVGGLKTFNGPIFRRSPCI